MRARVRDKLIGGVIEQVRRHGVGGCSVNEVLNSSGVARRSLYLNFPGGKLDLVHVATQVAGEQIAAGVVEALRDRSIAAGLTLFCDSWKASLTESGFEATCPVLGAAQARTESPQVADAAGTAFRSWETLIAERLHTDGVAAAEAAELATTIVAAVEGALVICQAQSSTEPLDRVCRHLNDLVQYYRGLGGDTAGTAAGPRLPSK